MVELTDGSMLAQLGVTDMRLPIQHAFSYPERWPAPLPPLDLARAGRLEFEVRIPPRSRACAWRIARSTMRAACRWC
jgi:1-deoxy-D-xylulose-5-phosphate reductoisomerase